MPSASLWSLASFLFIGHVLRCGIRGCNTKFGKAPQFVLGLLEDLSPPRGEIPSRASRVHVGDVRLHQSRPQAVTSSSRLSFALGLAGILGRKLADRRPVEL